MVKLPSKVNIEALIIGLVIGDGYMRIQEKSHHAYLEISHSLKQKQYLDFKISLVKKYLKIDHSIYNRIIKKDNKEYPVIKATFKSDSRFTHIYKLVYEDKIKTLRNIYDKFDKLSLALMYMDDGSCKVKKRLKQKNGDILLSDIGYIDAFMIATNCFSFGECKLFCNMLKNKFDIDATVQKDRELPRIAISNIKSKQIFIELIKPFVELVPDMLYKINKPIRMSDANFLKISG